ncbi:hypothetical protein NBRC116583_22870 [Arenicella sp. 4NH20-0111]|uniref:MBL fold metallo-hydrolase n=1 Tax=Arenicella sp. 4NH20-0111 TaxID=3127648 RepID=UPI00310C55F7
MKLWKKGLLGALIIVSAYVVFVFIQVSSISVERLEEDLFVIRGIGGNVTVLSTDKGTVVVDSMTFPMQGRLIKQKAEELTGAKVSLLINTHYHLDHTHGNPGFDPGTQVVATERTLSHLKALDAKFWEGDAALLLPNTTFSDHRTFDLGDKTISVQHVGRGHTDGDLIVFIEKYQTVVMGDLFFNRHYPNIDLEAGGSVADWPSTLDKTMELGFNRVIPGHGATTNREGLRQFRSFMQELADVGAQAKRSNAKLAATLEATKLTTNTGYEEISFAGIPLGLTRDFVVTRAWEEATGNFERRN